MPALYGLVPQAVQQHTAQRPLVDPEPSPITVEKRPDLTVAPPTKVVEASRATASSETNVSADPKPDKTLSPNINPTAESKVEAAAQDVLNPSELADQKAQDLARAREHAAEYREYKARTEATETRATIIQDGDPSPQQKLDIRLPLVDEIPDRPLPRLGVPLV